jgi:hypothetical protein
LQAHHFRQRESETTEHPNVEEVATADACAEINVIALAIGVHFHVVLDGEDGSFETHYDKGNSFLQIWEKFFFIRIPPHLISILSAQDLLTLAWHFCGGCHPAWDDEFCNPGLINVIIHG